MCAPWSLSLVLPISAHVCVFPNASVCSLPVCVGYPQWDVGPLSGEGTCTTLACWTRLLYVPPALREAWGGNGKGGWWCTSHDTDATPPATISAVFFFWRGTPSKKDYRMRSFEMCTKSSEEAAESHCWARSAHGSHVRTHHIPPHLLGWLP